MSNSIYISANSKDMFNIEIPTFDSGAIATSYVAPETSVSQSEFDVVANKSLISFGVMLVCILIFLVIAFLFKNKKQSVVESKHIPEKRRYNYNSEKVHTERVEQEYEQPENENMLYRHGSKKRSSLSTPNSINKCIRAFLENTKEN